MTTEMPPTTLAALQGSIKKWEKIVEGIGLDCGRRNCPLCQLFPDCTNCPVAKHTGRVCCLCTPYIDWWFNTGLHRDDNNYYRLPRESHETAAQAAAQNMLDLLRSLLLMEEPTKV